MISNGLNKVLLYDLVIVEILPVLEKESKFKKAQGLLFSGPPPPDVASGENFSITI